MTYDPYVLFLRSMPRLDLMISELQTPPVFADIEKAAKSLGNCTTDQVLKVLKKETNRSNTIHVGFALKKLGYKKMRTMINGLRMYVFFAP